MNLFFCGWCMAYALDGFALGKLSSAFFYLFLGMANALIYRIDTVLDNRPVFALRISLFILFFLAAILFLFEAL